MLITQPSHTSPALLPHANNGIISQQSPAGFILTTAFVPPALLVCKSTQPAVLLLPALHTFADLSNTPTRPPTACSRATAPKAMLPHTR